MRTTLVGLLSAASMAIAAPISPVLAEGFQFETPVGDVRVGPYRQYDRDYNRDRPRHHGTTGYNERSSDSDCRTITIRRDDGSVRRVRRCD
jgi:hypothetical protein